MIMSTVAMHGTLTLAWGMYSLCLGYLVERLLDFETSGRPVLHDFATGVS